MHNENFYSFNRDIGIGIQYFEECAGTCRSHLMLNVLLKQKDKTVKTRW